MTPLRLKFWFARNKHKRAPSEYARIDRINWRYPDRRV